MEVQASNIKLDPFIIRYKIRFVSLTYFFSQNNSLVVMPKQNGAGGILRGIKIQSYFFVVLHLRNNKS